MNAESDYFVEARSWALDEAESQSKWLRRAWIVAALACAVALFEAVALAMLLPLKTVSPVTLLVDRTTGYVEAVDPTSATQVRADEALVQSLLAQYVTARERFDRSTVKGDYRRTALWSGGNARTSYLAAMPASNPASPLNRYRPGDGVSVEVKSVSQLSPGNSLVRFDTYLVSDDGRRQNAGSWISAVRYSFSDAPMSYEDRLLNPLGLQVTSYRRDAERPSEASAMPTWRQSSSRDAGQDELIANEGETR